MNRKKFIKTSSLIFGTTLLFNKIIKSEKLINPLKKFEIPKLPYSYNALEPFIDAQTMEIHYTKHHQSYVNNLNDKIKGTPFENMSLEDMFKNSELPVSIRNNAGGHWNHSFFWVSLTTPNDDDNLKYKNIEIEKLKNNFNKVALSVFGSGWAWIIKKKTGDLEIKTSANQDNPLMEKGFDGKIILGLDIWEHAYYLKYQNKRIDYINAFWNIINWKKVNERLK